MESEWQVIGAAVQGISHQKQGLPCQDAQDYRVLPGGVLLAALAVLPVFAVCCAMIRPVNRP